MAKGHKPRAGSRAFWPKKRAPRMYSTVRSRGKGVITFAAYKAGMTQVSYVDNRKGSATQGKEVFAPATVLAAPSLVVVGIKAYQQTPTGLKDVGIQWTGSFAKELARKTTLPKKPNTKDVKGDVYRLVVHTKPRDTLGKKKPELFELPVETLEMAKEKLGKELQVTDVFKEGEYVDVKGVTKGKGFQGVVKRFGVTIRDRKAKKKRRHIGVLAPRGVARILPNSVAMAGQLGFQTRTEFNKQILKIADDGIAPKGGWVRMGPVKGSYLIVKGSIPGPKKRLVMLRKGIRGPGEEKVDVKTVVLDSQQ